jgi:hypothetical protein
LIDDARLSSRQISQLLAQIRAIGERAQERPLLFKFNDAERSDRARQALAKTPDINAEQDAQDNPNRRFVRNDQNVAVRVAAHYLADDAQAPMSD